jgi:hypothetical protein
MKKVVIGFSRPKKCSLLSKLIMKVQGTPYSHIYVKFYSASLNRELIYQASGLQVNFVGSIFFYDHHIAVKEFELEISDEVHLEALRFAVDKAGTPYSIKQLFSILAYMLTGKLLFRDGREAYVCSELIGEMLAEKIKITINKDLDIVIPKDIYNILSE